MEQVKFVIINKKNSCGTKQIEYNRFFVIIKEIDTNYVRTI